MMMAAAVALHVSLFCFDLCGGTDVLLLMLFLCLLAAVIIIMGGRAAAGSICYLLCCWGKKTAPAPQQGKLLPSWVADPFTDNNVYLLVARRVLKMMLRLHIVDHTPSH
jgi:hypothetical protein